MEKVLTTKRPGTIHQVLHTDVPNEPKSRRLKGKLLKYAEEVLPKDSSALLENKLPSYPFDALYVRFSNDRRNKKVHARTRGLVRRATMTPRPPILPSPSRYTFSTKLGDLRWHAMSIPANV